MRRSVALALLLLPVEAVADTAALSWANPTQYTDGTPLDQAITQTNLRCMALVVNGTRNPCPLADQKSTTLTYSWTYTITAYASGNICFAAQAQLADASVSDWSAEMCKAFPATKKVKPPTLVVK